MKTFVTTFLSILLLVMCGYSQTPQKDHLNKLIDEWHNAAANANQKAYFDFIAEGGIYNGTDATENWTKDEFFEWSKPHFEKGKAWSFSATERNIYFSSKKNIAWFDEQLEYSGGILRGSGVLEKEKTGWKLKHYVLSLPVPNEKYKDVMKVIKDENKSEADESLE